jgi:DnaJ-class molecular chaperone
MHDGATIRLGGQGEPGSNGGPAGDLLLNVQVAPHPYFRREGNDVILELPLSVPEAALGAKIDVPTLSEGKVTLTVPPGTSSGTRLRLRGKGCPDPKGKGRGDQLVIAKVVVPKDLNDKARELLEEFRAAAPQSPRAGLW